MTQKSTAITTIDLSKLKNIITRHKKKFAKIEALTKL